jgi:hypothetical protein
MEDITKFSFLKTLWYLRDYLSDIVIGGGWAPLIYYHYLLGDKTKNPVRTFDIDLMVKPHMPLRAEKTIDQLLTDAGLVTEYKSLDTPPIIHYEGIVENCCNVEIEFLTDQLGSKPDIVIEVQKGLHAEALRYISIATDNTVVVNIDDFQDPENCKLFQVTVPSPQAYIFHKGLVFEKRREELKKAKDLYYIFEVLLNCNAIETEIISGFSDLRTSYPAWFKKFLQNLNVYFANSSSDGVLMVLSQRPANVLQALKDEQFKQYVHGTFIDLIDKIGLG